MELGVEVGVEVGVELVHEIESLPLFPEQEQHRGRNGSGSGSGNGRGAGSPLAIPSRSEQRDPLWIRLHGNGRMARLRTACMGADAWPLRRYGADLTPFFTLVPQVRLDAAGLLEMASSIQLAADLANDLLI